VVELSRLSVSGGVPAILAASDGTAATVPEEERLFGVQRHFSGRETDVQLAAQSHTLAIVYCWIFFQVFFFHMGST